MKRYSLLVLTVLIAILVSACGGAATADSSPSGDKPRASLVEFTGVIEAIDGNQWTINGQVITVDPTVLRDGSYEVGDTVKIEAEVQADGTVVVTRVESPSDDDSNTNDDNSNDDNGNDNSNDDNGNDDNSNDDNGNDDNSNDDNGNDDNSNDDNGNDDNSNDDNGNDDSNDDNGNDDGSNDDNSNDDGSNDDSSNDSGDDDNSNDN